MRYVVFDFDGTIYLQEGENCAVNPIASCMLRELEKQGYIVAIITGRSCKQREIVYGALLSNDIRVKPSNFFCRDRDLPEVEWKKLTFERLLERLAAVGTVFEYHEDNPHVLELVSALDRNICLYLYTDGMPAVLRRTDRCVSEKMIEGCAKERYGI